MKRALQSTAEVEMSATIPLPRGRVEHLDRVGMVTSLACGLHCLAGSFVVASSGALELFADERVELGLVGVAVAIAVSSIALGVRRHRRLWPLASLATGIAVLALARGVEHAELVLSIAGAALLVLAHGANLRALQRTCACG